MSFVKNNRDELFDAVKEVAPEKDVEVYRLGYPAQLVRTLPIVRIFSF